jgi:hypothetical protein
MSTNTGDCTELNDHFAGSYKGKGCGDDFIARFDTQGHHGDEQCFGSVGN